MRISVSIPKGPYFDINIERLRGIIENRDLVVSESYAHTIQFSQIIGRHLYHVNHHEMLDRLEEFTVIMLGNYRERPDIKDIELSLSKKGVTRIDIPGWT